MKSQVNIISSLISLSLILTAILMIAHAEGMVPSATGSKKAPTFQEADKNQDHYITRDELQVYPLLLELFAKVDAGGDGKLEQHEYINLLAEAEREGYQ